MKTIAANSPVVLPDDGLVPLESILCTEELHRRPARAPDYATENRVLVALAQALADSPRSILQTMADAMLEVLRCDSAGFSLLTEDGTRFWWPAIAGAWQPHLGGGTPREFGPCGDVLDRDAPLLFRHWERRYPHLLAATPLAEEGLLVPFYVNGKAVGTIWAIAHDDRRKFDAEDLRQLESLGRFASAAYQTVEAAEAREQQRAALDAMEAALQAKEALRDSEQRLAAELADSRLLQELSAAMAEPGSFQDLYEKVLDSAAAVMRSDYASMQMLYPERGDGGELRLLTFRGFSPEASKFWEWVRADSESTCGMALRTRVRSIAADVEKCEFMAGTDDLATYLETGIHAVQSTPLISRSGGLVGMISTHWKQPHEPSERDLRLLDVVARHAADLIDRKNAEDTLRASEERYRRLVAILPAAVYTCEASGLITYFNEQAAALWGRAPQIGDTDQRFCGSEQLILPDGTPLAHEDCPMAVALREGRAFRDAEVNIRRPDGSMVPVRVNIDPVIDETGRVISAINVFHDVSRIKAAEEALRESEQRFRAVIDALPAAIYTTDHQGRVTHFNPAAVELTGRVPELGTDKWCVSWKLYHPDGTPMPHDECPMAIALKEGRPVMGEQAILERPDGSRRWFEPYPTPLKDAVGTVVGGINMLVDITERKQAQEPQATLAAIVQSSDDAIIGKSLDGVITSWNRGAERLFGYTAAEVVGRPVTILMPEDRFNEEPGILARLRRGEGIDHYETVRRRKDGSLVDISLTVSPVFDAHGRIIGASKIARDITERKRAAEVARQHGEQIEALLNAAPLGVYLVDADFRIREMNPIALPVFSPAAGPGGVIGRDVEELIHLLCPKDRAEHLTARFRHTLETGEPYREPECVAARPSRDGVAQYYDLRLDRMTLPDGRCGVVCYFRDIGQEVQARLKIAQSEERFRAMVNQATAGVSEADLTGRFTLVNRRYCDIVGYTEAELLSMRMQDLTHPDDLAANLAQFEALTRGGPDFIVEKRYIRKDGSVIWVNNSVAAVRDGEGGVRTVVAVTLDVTERRRAEAALQEHKDQLERAILARTAELELTHRQLRTSERLAAIGNLAAGLGHDLGNLLMPLNASVSALERADLPENLRERVGGIKVTSEYLRKLTSGLRLMASDPERARQGHTRLQEWWQETTPLLKTALPRGVRLDYSEQLVDDPECIVRISKASLMQVIFNLVQNAGEAVAEGARKRGTVRIRGAVADGCAVLTVEDDGPGMTPEVLGHCMEPYFSTKERDIQTGMGLALVHGLIRDAGGCVEVRSSPGEGAIFEVKLPCA